MWIISGAWIIGSAVLMICEGKAICDSLLLVVGIILVVWLRPVMTGKFNDVADVVVHLYDFSGEEGTPQGFIFLDGLLSFNFEGTQMSFKVEDQVEFYHGELG